MANGNMYTCANRFDPEVDPTSAGYFFPIFVADLITDGQTDTFTDGLCFQSYTFTYEQDYDDAGNFVGVTLTINARKPKSLMCRDWFFIGNTEIFHVETITKAGTHTISFTNLDENAQIDLSFGGLKIYMFCDGYIDTFISVLKTLMCFIGGLGLDPDLPVMGSHVPEYMEKANVEFLNNTMGY